MKREFPKAHHAYTASIYRAKEIYAKELAKVSMAITEAISRGEQYALVSFESREYKSANDADKMITTLDMLVALEGYMVSSSRQPNYRIISIGWSASQIKHKE